MARSRWPSARARGVVGGNITRTPGPLVVDVTAIGSVHRRRILRRSGARAGDYVFVSGTLGDARAGLALLADSAAGDAERGPRSWHATCSPSPGYGLDRLLGQSRAATSALDLSDGLADGLARLTTDHGLGCEIDAVGAADLGRVPGRCGTRVAPMRSPKPWPAATTTSWRSPSGRRRRAG